MVNFFMTMRGSWSRVWESVPLRFLATGAICWGLTCVQGVSQSFRTVSLYVHLTNWVVGHSHLAFVLDYTLWAFALFYLIVPQLVHRPAMYSRKLMEWHYWLITLGMVLYVVSLWIAGLIQGIDWMNGVPFINTVIAMHPFFGARLLGGLMAGIGILCFIFNVWMTSRQPAAALLPTLPAVPVATGGQGAG
jgi:cbb3-type cytochrome oxidase subunit 1